MGCKIWIESLPQLHALLFRWHCNLRISISLHEWYNITEVKPCLTDQGFWQITVWFSKGTHCPCMVLIILMGFFSAKARHIEKHESYYLGTKQWISLLLTHRWQMGSVGPSIYAYSSELIQVVKDRPSVFPIPGICMLSYLRALEGNMTRKYLPCSSCDQSVDGDLGWCSLHSLFLFLSRHID